MCTWHFASKSIGKFSVACNLVKKTHIGIIISIFFQQDYVTQTVLTLDLLSFYMQMCSTKSKLYLIVDRAAKLKWF